LLVAFRENRVHPPAFLGEPLGQGDACVDTPGFDRAKVAFASVNAGDDVMQESKPSCGLFELRERCGHFPFHGVLFPAPGVVPANPSGLCLWRELQDVGVLSIQFEPKKRFEQPVVSFFRVGVDFYFGPFLHWSGRHYYEKPAGQTGFDKFAGHDAGQDAVLDSSRDGDGRMRHHDPPAVAGLSVISESTRGVHRQPSGQVRSAGFALVACERAEPASQLIAGNH
jgi:hypothetical protein